MGSCCTKESVPTETEVDAQNSFKAGKQNQNAGNINGSNTPVFQAPADEKNPHAPKPYKPSNLVNLPNLGKQALESDAKFGFYTPTPPRRESFISYPDYPIMDYNGKLYKGQFKNGKPHGFGFLFDKENNAYEGWWENGLPRGHGRWIFSSGEIYDGYVESPETGNGNSTYFNGLREGPGRYMSQAKDSIYSGNWKNDKQHGKGQIEMLIDVKDTGLGQIISSFEGKFQNGLQHGQGVQRYKNGSQISGTWKNGKLDGVATWTSEDLADIKQCEWSNGEFKKWM